MDTSINIYLHIMQIYSIHKHPLPFFTADVRAIESAYSTAHGAALEPAISAAEPPALVAADWTAQ
jgi:hypothetical protein